MRLSNLDAEDANSHSSAYKGTSESEVASKNPHKTKKIADKVGDFQHYEKFALKNQCIFLFQWILLCAK